MTTTKTEQEIFKRLIQDSGVIMETGGYTLSSDKARELIKEAIHEARLAALDDCKTLIKASQDFYDAWKGLEIIRLDADWKKVKRLNDAGEKLLAELEALRTSYKEVLSRNADDKK